MKDKREKDAAQGAAEDAAKNVPQDVAQDLAFGGAHPPRLATTAAAFVQLTLR